MFIRGVGTATPATRYTKTECLRAFEQSDWFGRLNARSHLIARTVLQRDNGIDARRLAVATLDEVFRIHPDTLAQRFLAHAPSLAAAAGARALDTAAVLVQDIDAVVVSTCTGYLRPGLTGYVADDPGVLISAGPFGDGAGAAVLSRAPPAEGSANRRIGWIDSNSLLNPSQRDALNSKPDRACFATS